MRELVTTLLISLCVSIPSTAEETKHVFIAVDNGSHSLCYVDQFDPARNWTVKTDKKLRDIRLSSDEKAILISVDTGAIEYDLATGKKSGFAITNHTGIQSAQKLKDGNFLLATDKTIFVCDPAGKKLKTIPVAAGSTPYIRIVTVTRENTLLYTAAKPYCINEVDMNGEVVATVRLPEKSYKALRLENGNYLVSSGDLASVFELSPEGKVVKTYGGQKNHLELDLTFNSGWQKLENGNVVATCWHGHGYEGDGPHLVEYSPTNKAVWTWSHPDVEQVTNVLVLK
jgi:hypothetical protein